MRVVPSGRAAAYGRTAESWRQRKDMRVIEYGRRRSFARVAFWSFASWPRPGPIRQTCLAMGRFSCSSGQGRSVLLLEARRCLRKLPTEDIKLGSGPIDLLEAVVAA